MSSVTPPVEVKDHFKITQHGVPVSEVVFNTVTMESGDVICVRMSIEQPSVVQSGEQKQPSPSPIAPAKRALVVIDVNANKVFVKTNAQAESAIMHPKNRRWIGLKVGTGLQVFDLRERKRISGCDMKKDFPLFWRWIDDNNLVVISPQNVHHWNVDENNATGTLTHVFSRPNDAPFNTATIINYHVSKSRQSHIIVTLSKDKNTSDVKGLAQFYSNGKLEVIPAHAANFFQFVPIEQLDSQLLLITAYHLNGTTGELSIRNLTTNEEARKYTFPLYSNEDFPVVVEQSEKVGIIYVVSKFGGIYLFDIETGALLFRDKISQENIFCGIAYSDPSKRLFDGVIMINKAAQVQSVLTNPKALMSHCMRNGQTMVALRIAVRMNAQNASDLWWAHFDNLLKDKKRPGESIKLAIESPYSMLRTRRALEALEEFGSGSLLQYFKVLSQRGIEMNEDEVEVANRIPETAQFQLKRPSKKKEAPSSARNIILEAISEAKNGAIVDDEHVITIAVENRLFDELVQYSFIRADEQVDRIIIEKMLQDEGCNIIAYGEKKGFDKHIWIHDILESLFDRGQLDRAQVIAIYLLETHPSVLQNIIDLFIAEEKRLVPILEHAIGTNNPTQEMYTELAILYARHQHDHLQEYLEFNSARVNMPQLIATLAQLSLWDDLRSLANQVNPDDFVSNVVNYCKNVSTWDHDFFTTIAAKCEREDVINEAARYYIHRLPNLLSDFVQKVKPDQNFIEIELENAGLDPYDVLAYRSSSNQLIGDASPHHFVRSASGTLHPSQSIDDIVHENDSPPQQSDFDFFSDFNKQAKAIDSKPQQNPPQKKLPPIPKHLQKVKQERIKEEILLSMEEDENENHDEEQKHHKLHMKPHPINRLDDSLFVHLHDPIQNGRSSSTHTSPNEQTLITRNKSVDHLLLTMEEEHEETQEQVRPVPMQRNRSEGRFKTDRPSTPTSPGTPTRSNRLIYNQPISEDENMHMISVDNDKESSLLQKSSSGKPDLLFEEFGELSTNNNDDGLSALDALIGPIQPKQQQIKEIDPTILQPKTLKKANSNSGSMIEFPVHPHPGYESTPSRNTIVPPTVAEIMKTIEVSRNDGTRSHLERFKGFTISQKLGQGSQASIFLAKDEYGQHCVLKAMKLSSPQELEMALQESATLSILKHPNIVALNKVFIHEDEVCKYVCFSMPYYSYGDLDRIIFAQRNKWPENFIVNCLSQLADALAFIHARNIMHRDLKPANIFVQPRMNGMQLFLGDFGLSKTENSKKDSGPVGTQIYMAPEVRNNQPYDFKADVFSLGCIMVQMMTLKMRRDLVAELQIAHVSGRDYFKELRIEMSGYSRDLIDLCLCMLHPLPHMRPSAEQIARHPLVLQGGM